MIIKNFEKILTERLRKLGHTFIDREPKNTRIKFKCGNCGEISHSQHSKITTETCRNCWNRKFHTPSPKILDTLEKYNHKFISIIRESTRLSVKYECGNCHMISIKCLSTFNTKYTKYIGYCKLCHPNHIHTLDEYKNHIFGLMKILNGYIAYLKTQSN